MYSVSTAGTKGSVATQITTTTSNLLLFLTAQFNDGPNSSRDTELGFVPASTYLTQPNAIKTFSLLFKSRVSDQIIEFKFTPNYVSQATTLTASVLLNANARGTFKMHKVMIIDQNDSVYVIPREYFENRYPSVSPITPSG